MRGISKMSEYEEEKEEESTSLVDQLGTSNRKIMEGDVDMRLLTVITDPSEVPTSLRPLLYVLTRADVTIRGKSFWEALSDNALHLFVGIGGRGRRDLIRGEQVRRGQAVSVESEIRKPGWVERNLVRRNWEREEKEKLGID